MVEEKMNNEKKKSWLDKFFVNFGTNKTQNTVIAAFTWITYLFAATTFAQAVIFLSDSDWKGFGLSILVGTCGVMLGAFSAFLASPFNPEEEKRISRVTAIIATIITGYILGKLIDPLISSATKDPTVFFTLLLNSKNSANALIVIIGFLGGFLGTYQIRAYLPGLFSTGEQSLEKNDEIIKVSSSKKLEIVENPPNKIEK